MINLVVALQCEARPLIQHFRLRGSPKKNGFSLYHNEEICLVISGIGKINAAAATAYLQAITGNYANQVWLNIGIAGHREMLPGEAVLAHKLTDAGSQQNWYPGIVIKPPCQTAAVITVDNPENSYNSSTLYEMEASGFYATACRFSTSELVHCFKVVSDNPENPSHLITEKTAENLVSKHIATIDSLIRQLQRLATELSEIERPPKHFERCLEHWHFTTYEQHQLRQLLQRAYTLAGSQVTWDDIKSKHNGKDVIIYLKQQIQILPVQL